MNNKMTKDQKAFFKTMCIALNSDGYFVSANAKKGIILVMAANPDHNLLVGVSNSVSSFLNVVDVNLCPLPTVCMISFKK